jgi:predicted ATPase
VNKSLVQVEEVVGRTRYSLLEMVRHYAKEHLESSGRERRSGAGTLHGVLLLPRKWSRN